MDYLNKIILQYPKLSSGRKNYKEFNQRLKKNLNLIKYFINKNKLLKK